MNLQPDSQRQWFVYFQEKEMGPFAENLLLKKIREGELDVSAYVFTEGMTDWTLVSDIPHLNGSPNSSNESTSNLENEALAPQAESESNLQPLETKKEESSSENSDILNTQINEEILETTKTEGPQIQTSSPLSVSSQTEKLGVARESKSMVANSMLQNTQSAPTQEKPKKSRFFLRLVLTLGVLGVFGFLAQKYIKEKGIGHYLKEAKKMTGIVDEEYSETIVINTESKGEGKSTNIEEAKTTNNDQDISIASWDELLEFRNSSFKKKHFLLRSFEMNESFPKLEGVLHKSVKDATVHAVIYPDLRKNLSPLPFIWRFDVPTFDGFFSIGPLVTNKNGKAPIGRYILKILVDGEISTASFEVGNWPSEARVLAKKQDSSFKQKRLAAETEQRKIEENTKNVQALALSLKKLGALAVKRKSGRVKWQSGAQKWREAFAGLIGDLKDQSYDPLFYPGAHAKTMDLMGDLLNIETALDAFSRGGKKLMAKNTGGKKIGDLWNAYTEKEAAVIGGLQDVGNNDDLPSLTIDENLVEEQMLGEELN